MLYSIMEKNSQKYGNKVLFQIKRGDQYVKYTYQEVLKRARLLASKLRETGIKTGDHVALWSESTPEWCIGYAGIHFSGAVVVPMDIQYQENIVINLAKFAEIKAMVCTESALPKVNTITKEVPMPVFVLEPGAEKSIFAIEKETEGFEPYNAKPDDIMSLIFTSGTTGEPKGVMLTANNFISNAQTFLTVGWVTPEKDAVLGVLPLHHCYAFITTCMLPFISSIPSTFQPILKGPAILSAIQETGVTIFPAVPKLLAMFCQTIFENVQKQSAFKKFIFWRLYNISSRARRWFGLRLGTLLFGQIHKKFGEKFRYFVSGGAKLDPDVAEKMWNLGFQISEGYGLTETAPVICATLPFRFFPGSVGKAMPDEEIKIVNPDSQGVGEVAMRGPNMMKGYFKHDDWTADVIKDGWFHTGDLGFIDKIGGLHITGRAKELIVLRSGKKVYPDEVEKHYEKCPLIAEMCAFGEKHTDGGTAENLTAIIVPNFDEIKRQQINSIYTEIKFCIENLAMQVPSYMHLKSFKIVSDPLPRTRLGKLRRPAIENMQFQVIEEEGKVEHKMSDEDKLLLAKPSSEAFLQRLQKFADYQKEIMPGDSLELDLGLDSMKRMELLVIIEQEFGVKVPPDASLTHVRDILTLLSSDKVGGVGTAKFSWKTILAQKREPSLEQMFNLKRGCVKTCIIEVLRFFVRMLLRICYGIQTKGFERLNEIQGPVVLGPTHQSYLDPLILYAFLPRKRLHKTVFIALDAMFQSGIMSLLVRPGRIIKTASSKTNISSLQYAADALSKGFSVCIFPEGQRSSSGKLEKALIGPGILACERKVPVLPVVINGAMISYSRTNPGFHFGKIKLEMLNPIYPPEKEEYCEDDYLSLMDIWSKTVVDKIELPEKPV